MLGFAAGEIKVKQIFKQQQLFFLFFFNLSFCFPDNAAPGRVIPEVEEVSFPTMTQFQMSQKHYKVYCILKKLTALCCSKFRFTADSLSLVSFFFHHPSFSNTCTFICAHTTHLLSLYNEITQPSSPNSWLGPCSALKPRVCHPRSLLVEQQEKNIKIGTFPPSFPA